MIYERCSGILLHIASLPAAHGIGDLGDSAHGFVDFLAAAGQKIWQVLPLSPTGYGDSPYQSFSAFAGNPLFIDLLNLQQQGRLESDDLEVAPQLPGDFVDYGRVIAFKRALLPKAAKNFFINANEAESNAFETFCKNSAMWLDDYALFMAGKDFHNGSVWTDWDSGLRKRDPDALEHWRQKLLPEMKIHQFAQFEFFRQWTKLKDRCRQSGIRIMGDIPNLCCPRRLGSPGVVSTG